MHRAALSPPSNAQTSIIPMAEAQLPGIRPQSANMPRKSKNAGLHQTGASTDAIKECELWKKIMHTQLLY
jgi:hypothetical protein